MDLPEKPEERGRIALLPFSIALSLMLGLTLRPDLLADSNGHADHAAATLLCWAMAAGFVRGVGFIPHHPVWRWAFSAAACLLALLLGIWRIVA